MRKSKICKFCSKTYERASRLSDKQWDNREFCSNVCSSGYKGGTWKKGQSGNLKGRAREGEYVLCKNCGVVVYRSQGLLKDNKNIFCSRKCTQTSTETRRKISSAHTGKIVSEVTKERIRQKLKGHKYSAVGNKSHLWKGGLPKCPTCIKNISYRAKTCKKHRPEEYRMNHAKALIGKMPKNIMGEGKFGNVKRGWFQINGKRMFFRSMWEANYALYLDFLIKQKQIVRWSYEDDVFIFHKIQFGTRSYRPDFKIWDKKENIEYHEVKGWITPRSKTQLNRMRIYYPDIKLILIGRKEYSEIKTKLGGL